MTVSIIVPVFNVEKWLPSCLDSILQQSFTDWELILVDDGSKDHSSEICDDYARRDARIKVIHTENHGVSCARNEGIKNAQGTFITFLDSDDSIRPNYLANFSYDLECDFEIQGFTLTKGLDDKGFQTVLPDETKTTTLKEAYCEAELKKLSRGPCCKLYKHDVITQDEVFFPTGLHFGEDAIFVKLYLLHCDNNKHAKTIAKADYLYNYHEGESLTKKRHRGVAFYRMASMDYELFMQLQSLWGSFPENLICDFTHIRTLEFYQSIILFFSEKHSRMEKRTFLSDIKNGLFKDIQKHTTLPVTYKIIRVILLFCPIWLAIHVLHVLSIRYRSII